MFILGCRRFFIAKKSTLLATIQFLFLNYYLRWASLGECFIALYDHLTSPENPQVNAYCQGQLIILSN